MQNTFFKKQIKLIGINIIILSGLIFISELTHRALKLTRTCLANNCNYKYLFHRAIHIRNKRDWSDIQTSSSLGFEVKKNLFLIQGQNQISTLSNGLRKSIPNNQNSIKILTVGDSFAFGAEVDDKQTWQSCLNRRIPKYNFLNGGNNGYGTGQAILRAKEFYPEIKPSYLLVQTLIGHNFARDQLVSRNGLLKPYFAKDIDGSTVIITPKFIPKNKNEYQNFYKNKISPSLFNHMIVNFTLLERFSVSSHLYKLWHRSYSKFTPISHQWGTRYASIKDIMEWSVTQSKLLDPSVIWLFQYTGTPTMQHLDERNNLIKILNNHNVSYVDSFDYIFGKFKTTKDISKLWSGHHTALGNEVVCDSIIKSNLYK